MLEIQLVNMAKNIAVTLSRLRVALRVSGTRRAGAEDEIQMLP